MEQEEKEEEENAQVPRDLKDGEADVYEEQEQEEIPADGEFSFSGRPQLSESSTDSAEYAISVDEEQEERDDVKEKGELMGVGKEEVAADVHNASEPREHLNANRRMSIELTRRHSIADSDYDEEFEKLASSPHSTNVLPSFPSPSSSSIPSFASTTSAHIHTVDPQPPAAPLLPSAESVDSDEVMEEDKYTMDSPASRYFEEGRHHKYSLDLSDLSTSDIGEDSFSLGSPFGSRSASVSPTHARIRFDFHAAASASPH
eukprot:GILI01011943.1.p1 GENE.GILI01011943.1~~GILI01011943.1.p1  ORF type:complete len:300 (-),score=100.02 GILI01011943.1:91-867(-)